MKILSLLGIVGLLCATPAFAAENSTKSYQNCQNLKKIKDIDDLLYQMHSNLDGDCLFKMPSNKLAKIWGIPIIDYADYLDDRGFTDRPKHYQAEKQYWQNAKKPSLYVFKKIADGAETMTIHENRALLQRLKSRPSWASYNGNLAKGKLPKYLPQSTVAVPRLPTRREEYFGEQGEPTPDTEYKNYFVYCWFNEHEPENYLAITTSTFGVEDIIVSNHVHFFEEQCKQNPNYYFIPKIRPKGKIK